jgi:hypothetical protein
LLLDDAGAGAGVLPKENAGAGGAAEEVAPNAGAGVSFLLSSPPSRRRLLRSSLASLRILPSGAAGVIG